MSYANQLKQAVEASLQNIDDTEKQYGDLSVREFCKIQREKVLSEYKNAKEAWEREQTMSESKKISTWVAVDADGSEWIFTENPYRYEEPKRKRYGNWLVSDGNYMELPKGSIKALIGRELTWNDEPVELKEPVSPCIDCECAKFADEVIKPKQST